MKFEGLSEKSWAPHLISYWNYRLEKAELLKYPKSPAPELLQTVNILKSGKHWLNPNGSIFVIIFDHSQRKSASKTVF